MEMNGGWVLEADIEGFFDSVDKARLQEILRRRVRDGVLLRLVGKWLNAGVLEEGRVYRPEAGTPQGGVISPILANIYLHEVLDEWFAQGAQPRLRGRAHLVRYCDDFVIAFEHEEDARRVLDVLPKRFGKYGLRLHPEKTRLVCFERPSWKAPPGAETGRPRSFDLLGFTHYWRRSRQGNWVVYRKTASSRLSRALRATALWLRRNRHEPIAEQHRVLVLKLRGHYNYYGIIGNFAAMDSFRSWARVLWCKWLSRRSGASRGRDAMGRMLEVYPLPRPRIMHAV
jgi:group II intron reverse transcriptase/maturase